MDYKTIVEDFDWSQLSFEELKLVNSKISAVIKQKKSELRPPQSVPQIVQQLHAKQYKAEVSQVRPRHRRSSLSEYQKCLFGISLSGNQNFDGGRLEACIKWISNNFKHCLVLVADSVHRHTIEISSGLKGNSARVEAFRVGREFVERQRALFEYYSANCLFEFMMASEVEKQPDFELYIEQLQRLYREDRPFETTVRSFAQAYLHRGNKVQEKQADEFSHLEHLAASYLLEECAILACLARDGWLVNPYPGSIKAFEDITEGKHPEVPEPLQQVIFVSLRLKKAGIQFVSESLGVTGGAIEHQVAV